MFLKVLVFFNGAFAAAFLLLGGYGAIAATNPGDSRTALLSLFAGLFVACIMPALRRQSRLAVVLLSLPVIGAAAFFAFILLFAPLAWGDANLPTTYLLQGCAVLLILVQLAGIVAVFSRRSQKE